MIRLRVLVIVAAMAVLALVLSGCEGGPTELDELPLSELGGDCRTDANCVAGLHCCENTCHECCADYDCDEDAGERCDDDHKCVKVVEPPSEPETEPGEEEQSPPAPLPEEEQVVPLIEGETEDEWIQWFQEEWYWAWEFGDWDDINDLWDLWIQTFYPEKWAEICARRLMFSRPMIKVLHWTGPVKVIYVIEDLAILIDNVFTVYVDVTTVQNQTTSQVIYLTPKEDGSPAIFPDCACGLAPTPTEPESACITDQECGDWDCCPDGICHECCGDEDCDADDYCDYQHECWSREAAGIPCGDVICRQGEQCVDDECAECAIDGDCDPEGICFAGACVTPACMGDSDCEPDLWCSGCTCREITLCDTAADCGEAEACVQYKGLFEDTGYRICVPEEQEQAATEPEPGVPPSVAQFVELYNAAFASGDDAALAKLIHDDAKKPYGEAQCQEYAAEVIENPVVIKILDWTGPSQWLWQIDGLSILIPNAYAVDVDFTTQGQTTQMTIHLAERADGSLGFFTDCGDPLSEEDVVEPEQPPPTTGTTVNASLPQDMGGRTVLFENNVVYLLSGSVGDLPPWYGLDPSVAIHDILQAREAIASADLQGGNVSFPNLNLPRGRYFLWAGYRVCRGGLVRQLLVAEFDVTDREQVNVALGWY